MHDNRELIPEAAEETLLDHAILSVGPEVFAKFVARLDAPPKSNAQLRRTMRTPAPWVRS